MAFGKRREPDSYGVPVRPSTAPAAPAAPAVAAPPAQYHQEPAAPSPAWASAPAAPAGYAAPQGYAPPPVQVPLPSGAQYAGGAPSYAPQAQDATGYAPPQVPPQYARQGWAPAPPGYDMQPAYASAAKSNRTRNIVIGVVSAFVALPLLAAVAIPVFLNQRGPVKAPQTLAGRPMITTPEAQQVAKTTEDAMAERNHGLQATVAMYGQPGAPEVLLIAMRGRLDEGREVRDAEQQGVQVDTKSRQESNGIVCYRIPTPRMGMCMWSGSISGWVSVMNSNDLDEISAVAREARQAL